MIYEDALDIEDIEINDDDNGQEEDQNKKGLNIITENQYPVNKEVIYITEEEDNNEVNDTNM